MTAYDYAMGQKKLNRALEKTLKNQHIYGIQFHPKTNSVSNRNQLVS